MSVRNKELNLSINQGSSFSQVFTIRQTNGELEDLTDVVAVMQLKEDYGEELIIEFSVAETNLTIDTGESTITVSLTAAVTAGLDFDEVKYDLELTDGSEVYKAYHGSVTLIKEITT